ncbi:hypothetical protein CNMCM5793_003137 [Aspergillus hiratsukae]|uniref:Uncharacterized protein n=1 Tax=Aspergillus hiratsukae TaxID=1194566 RepID=A0A8H6Q6N2_9EURO|nr:hypothetical protein CNMCM5793_003137 [Aspergillus hiratsukae]KAF7166567.1 hypothetical protein CNMCM6106_002342 [Aspergillus hiratsukae]
MVGPETPDLSIARNLLGELYPNPANGYPAGGTRFAKMNVTVETELMQNQKHARIMAPDKTFDVLQTSDGGALFFSIGDDGVFYLTREVTATETGWTKISLSSSIPGGNPVAAKSFALSQNPQSMALDMALITTIDGVDSLYICLGHSIDEDGWENSISWTLVPFDATSNTGPITAPDPLTIADVFIMNIPYSGTAVESIFVDIRRDPNDNVGLLDRYYIQPGASPQWVARPMQIDLIEGSISCCLGHRPQDYGVPGIYTLGMIGSETELIYIPQTNPFRHGAPPTPVILNVPTGASCISSALITLQNNPDVGSTNLFIAGTDGIHLFTPQNESENVDSLLVIPAASVDNGEAFAFYLHNQASNNVLFVHLADENLLQLTQDPSNGSWSQRSILLPSTDNGDIVQFSSFTSHLQITDVNGVNLPNTSLSLTSTTPVSVYIDNDYHLLTPSFGVAVETDITGAVTIIQATEALSNTSFNVTLTDSPDTTVLHEDGSIEPLIPVTVSPTDKVTAAHCISQFLKVKDTLPPDGSTVTPPSNPSQPVPIGDQIYHAVMDCYNAIAGAIEFVMNKIEVAFEKVVAWLGFIFNWSDIKRAHLVMKNIVKQYTYQVVNTVDGLEGDISNAFTNLEQAVSASQLKKDCVDNFSDLTPIQVIQRVMAILAEFVLKSAQNVITTVIDVAKLLIETVLDYLDAPLNIPVISPLYKKFVGDDLSFLDLVCLIGAIPTTIIYKLITKTAPFPDNDQTQALINAGDMTTIINIITSDSPCEEKAVTAAQGLNTTGASLSNIVTASLNITAFFGSIIVALFSALKRYGYPTPTIRIVSATSYLIYTSPNITGLWINNEAWYTLTNDTVTGISIIKTVLDNTKTLSNNELYSKFPTCDWISLGANLAFDLGGMLTVFTTPDIMAPPYCEAVFLITEALCFDYGAPCVGSAGTLLDANHKIT